MIKCPKCLQIDFVQKAGITRGKQRYFCKDCDYHFTLPTPSATTENKRHHQVTIMDIAHQLGISKSTVSRALRGHSDIHEGTRKMILDLAQQLEYQPNPLANALLKSRTNIVGILVPEFRHYFFPTMIMGAQEVLSKAGYNVMICQSDESYETEMANVKALMSSRVDGLLVSVTAQTNNFDHFRAVLRKEVPMVFFNRVCPELETPQVIVDDYEGAFQAVEHLIKQGYRRIAHLAGPNSLLVSRLRLNGYRDALQKHGLPLDPDLIIHYDLSEEKARIYANYLLSLPQPPDAIFAINDPTAIEIMLVAKSRGVKIPQELGIVGFSNDPVSAIIEPSLTTIEQPVWEMGRQAAKLLLEQMEHPHNVIHTLPTRLIIRNSSVNLSP
ncbi:LacI family DNA-binding transcriptional regulator [Runella zeae]|jgi:DNA-binding LacI/PurR family transcriptional regulator|uniref:LacI family DNA-binding transcriptional regulator n=1 Tax=Runella zeae TaxID=94255 RepID=UPI00048B0437